VQGGAGRAPRFRIRYFIVALDINE
jgi:hypothetical protein